MLWACLQHGLHQQDHPRRLNCDTGNRGQLLLIPAHLPTLHKMSDHHLMQRKTTCMSKCAALMSHCFSWKGESSIPNLCASNVEFETVKLSGELWPVLRPMPPSRQETHLDPYCMDFHEAGAIMNASFKAKELMALSENSANNFQPYSL